VHTDLQQHQTPATPLPPPRPAKQSLWFDRAILFLFLIIALSIPFSTKLAVHAFRAAALLWLVRLVIYRPKLRAQPLALPIFVFLVLTAISSTLSYEPAQSWSRMRTVSLLLLVPLLVQMLGCMKQVRVLAGALLFATLLSVVYTAWQYSFGIGVALEHIKTGSALDRAGLLPGDVITKVGDRRIYSPSSLRERFEHGPLDEVLNLKMRRGAPPEWYDLRIDRAELLEAGLTAPGALGRGHPVRAQGFFNHYVPFSELLMLAAALTFGLAWQARTGAARNLLILAFVAICAGLLATATRAPLASLALACTAVVWLFSRWKVRLISLAVLVLVVAAASLWFQHARGKGWYQKNDDGSAYRELMWRDGARLARQHPWFGVGMDSIYRHWQEWDIHAYRRFPHLKSHFHSAYVQTAVEAGVPALLAWLWILASVIVLLVRYAGRFAAKPGMERGVVIGALASTLALCINSIVHYTSGDAEFMLAFWFLGGLAISVVTISESGRTGGTEPTAQVQQ